MHTDNVVPYSKKALESLAKILKMHQSLAVWLDPASNTMMLRDSTGQITYSDGGVFQTGKTESENLSAR